MTLGFVRICQVFGFEGYDMMLSRKTGFIKFVFYLPEFLIIDDLFV